MSIIIAVRKNGRTIVASDTLTSFGDSHRLPPENTTTSKVRIVGAVILGGAGWGVYDQILDAHLDPDDPPPLSNELDIFEFFVDLWKAMHDNYTLVNDQSQSKDSPFGDLDSSFLIAAHEGIFKVSSDLAVTRFEQYYAIGSGSDYALGALHQLYELEIDAMTIARRAVETAVAFDAYCGGKIRIDEAS